MAEPRLFTASWTALWRASQAAEVDVQPVRISRSSPKFWPGDFPVIEALIPTRGAGEPAYRQQLDRVDVSALSECFAVLAAESGLPLALCCYENDPADCHRSWWSTWWESETGQAIPEWAAPCGR